MRFATFVYHAGEGYLPDTLKVQPHDPNVEGYLYNESLDEPDEDKVDVVIEGDSFDACYAQWLEYAIGCTHIRGADDDHYDYFPSNFSGLVHLAMQIDKAFNVDRCTEVARRIWDDLAFDRWACNLPLADKDESDAEFDSEIHPRP